MSVSRFPFIASLCLCLLASACGELPGPLNVPRRRKADEDRLLPLDPGVRLADAEHCCLAWSADGREVLYAVAYFSAAAGATQFGIRAKSFVDSTAPERHIVDALDGPVLALAGAPDPAWLYYIEQPDSVAFPSDSLDTLPLYRVAAEGGMPELIDANALPEANRLGMPAIIAAPDGNSIVYAGRIDQPGSVDSIFLFRSTTGAKHSISSAAGGRPLSFSPDGRRLLFERSLNQDRIRLYIADLATDSVWGFDNVEPWAFLNWGPTGILRLEYYNLDVLLEDMEAGTWTGLVMDGYVGLDTPSSAAAGWAPDGSPVVWKIGCSNMLGDWCVTQRAALYGFDTSGGNPRVLAVVNDPDTQVRVAFSPDGLRVAYIATDGTGTGLGVFVHDVRP